MLKYTPTATLDDPKYYNHFTISRIVNGSLQLMNFEEGQADMGNGTTFSIWTRTVAPTRAEVEYYLSAFAEEDAQYPEMFSQVAEAWLTAHGL